MSGGTPHGNARILCIRLSGLGDVVHALSALALLRHEMPDALIAWAVEERFADLLRGHPQLDELIAVPRTRWGRMVWNPLRWPGLARERRRTAARLRSLEFGASVDFQSSLKSSWLVRAARAPLRIGFGGQVNRELNHRVQNRLVEVPSGRMHRVERDLMLLEPLGITPRYEAPVLPCSEPAEQTIDDMLKHGLTGGPTVVIHPGTSGRAAFKRWPPERYGAVADRLIAERGADVLVTYGRAEQDLAARLRDGMRGRAVFVPPVAGLAGLIELLRRADLFIGGDTGPMHLASALKVPVVALFGPKDPVQTGPYCSRRLVVTADTHCRPCDRRRCADPLCMMQITTGQVCRAALEVLDGGGEYPAQTPIFGAQQQFRSARR